jgi:hypothetical protein
MFMSSFKLRLLTVGTSMEYSMVLFFSVIFLFAYATGSAVANDSEGPGRIGYLRAQKLKEFFAPETAMEETAPPPPEMPQSENFTEYEISGISGSKFFADVSSLSVGEDGVIRLALGTRSTSGAWSLTYEGFRCDSYEYRIYGTSRGFDNEWRKNRRSKWTFAKNGNARNMRFDLARYYLCNVGPTDQLTKISQRLEKGRLEIKTDRGT